MKKVFFPIGLFILFFTAGFAGFFHFYPAYKVKKTLNLITRGTMVPYRWFYVPRLTGMNRSIRRVSDDVLYAYCLFDLSQGDVSVRLSPWEKLQSASVFSMNSDHHYSVRSNEGEAVSFTISKSDVPFTKGFIMMRRLSGGEDLSHQKDDACRSI